jgi:hypothetical protein
LRPLAIGAFSARLAISNPSEVWHVNPVKLCVLLLATIPAGPVAAQTVDVPAAPPIAQREHGRGGLHMHGGGGRGGGRNSVYANARIEEKDRLLGKLKSICRGC